MVWRSQPIAILLLLLVITACLQAQEKASPKIPAEATRDPITTSRRNAIVKAIEKVAPSVVGVTTTTVEEYQVRYPHPFWEYFYYPGVLQEKRPSIGSGFVIREDGYILTNHHVVEGAQEITVTFADGRSFNVEDVRKDVMVDRQMDLAVIRINARDLPVVELGDPEDVIIGEWAIALGNPFGLLIEDPKPTVTVGVISAVNRNFRLEQNEGGHIYQDMIQTDASINPGNSGGPLVNSIGQVIGTNTFILSKSGGSLGIGFAIPIHRAAEVARKLIEGGSQEFWTGFWLHANLTPWLAHALGLASSSGALITRVEDNSPASRAKLSPGDLVIRVNSRRVRSDEDVAEAFRNGRVGEVFTVQILRGRRQFDTRLVLEQAPLNQ
ncbi:MAG: trypsin-like peptidase domain-containing protein [bacterium]|nr:trypsin-like peptidase domain-containing protein [bacterium]